MLGVESSNDLLMFFNDLIMIFGGLAGTVYVVLVLTILALTFLMPLIIYLIHRSTKRTAIAVEKIAKQNEQLIDVLSKNEDFSLGDFRHESSRK